MTFSIEDAKSRLPELLAAAARGETVLISQDQSLVVRLVPIATAAARRHFGSAHGLIKSADDFDAPLEEFREYEQ